MNFKKCVLPALAAASCMMPLDGADFAVEKIDGVPRITMDGKAITPRIFAGNFLYGGGRKRVFRPGNIEEIRMAAETGIVIVSPEFRPLFDDVPKSRENLEKVCKMVLDIDSRIYLMPRFSMTIDMVDMPPWAIVDGKINSTEGDVGLVDNGQKHPSIDDPRFRAEMLKSMRQTVEFLEEKFGNRMAGYHIGGLKVCEWQYLNFENVFTGYDVGTRNAFREWLRKKYGTDEALAKAWNRPGITFDQVLVPTDAERRGRPGFAFREPAVSQFQIDFDFFRNEDMCDIACELAQVVRDVCGKRRLTCLFYGYIFECSTTPTGPATVGHCTLQKMLKHPAVDLLTGPFSYMGEARELGGSSVTHTAAESITAAGKVWINEDDLLTPIGDAQRAPRSKPYGITWDEIYLKYRAQLAAVYARNYGIWWFDLHGTSWYNHQPMWDETVRVSAAPEKVLISAPAAYEPEVCLTIDEDSLKYAESSRDARLNFRGATYQIRDRVSRSSTRWGSFLLSDLLEREQPSKLDIHSSAFALTREQRIALRERAAKTATIWMWAPGYVDVTSGKFSTDAVRELTGFSVYKVDESKKEGEKTETEVVVLNGRKTVINKTDAVSAVMEPWAKAQIAGLPDKAGFGMSVDPVLAVKTRPGDRVIARYARSKAPAIVWRPAANGKAAALFCGVNELPQALVRFMAKQGGAQIYCEKDLHINANEKLLAFTAPADGKYTVNSGYEGVWFDPQNDRSFPGPVIRITMKKGETVFLFKEEVK
ncbi:MAG: beta-galactosidase [Lentisphaeria bacterium]|nr:beta-galactosidase [Lentisphaeria bacterium]